jgi:hypothetical protein
MGFATLEVGARALFPSMLLDNPGSTNLMVVDEIDPSPSGPEPPLKKASEGASPEDAGVAATVAAD